MKDMTDRLVDSLNRALEAATSATPRLAATTAAPSAKRAGGGPTWHSRRTSAMTESAFFNKLSKEDDKTPQRLP
jgi:hypothetical protein